MAQNRKPPAYQEYPASFLANKNFRFMSLEERGLLMTMRFECWENLNIPSNRLELAKYLGLDVSAIPLTEGVLSFFTECGESLICPELENYRKHLQDRREKQSKGGKIGAEKTNKARATRRDSCESLDKHNLAKINKDQSLENGYMEHNEEDDWLKDYEDGDSNFPF